MRLRRIKAVAWKETLHVLRDPRSLGLAVAIPLLLIVLFGWVLTLDVDQVPLAVWDRSNTPASREFIGEFAASRYFTLVGPLRSYRDLEEALDSRRALLALVIPADFAAKTASGREAEVQAVADGSDPNTAAAALGYARVIASGWSARLSEERLASKGKPTPPAPARMRPRVWYNPELESRNFIIPGLIVVVMMVIAALLTSLAVSREWETGTMELLVSTPLSGTEIILGKLVPYFAVGMLDVVLGAAMGRWVFGVPLRGSAALVLAASALFLAGALSMGMLISVVTRSQLLSTQAAMIVTFLPAFLLSGFIFPIYNMPAAVRAATYLVPARYLMAVLRAIYLKGLGVRELWGDMLLLCAFAAGMSLLVIKRFRKKLE